MSTFDNIIWWYGVVLFSISVTLFYGGLAFMVFQYLKEKFKK
jgi:hypothetical protein